MPNTNINQIKPKDDFVPNYGYAYNNGKNVIEFYAVDENVAHMKACKWAINTNNFIQPLGKVLPNNIKCCYCGDVLGAEYVKATDGIIDTPKYAHKKCMK